MKRNEHGIEETGGGGNRGRDAAWERNEYGRRQMGDEAIREGHEKLMKTKTE